MDGLIEIRHNEWHLLQPAEVGAATGTPSVSVIIPVRDSRDRLERLVASLSRQTYPGELIEVIVVDDGSDTEISPSVQDGDVAVTVVRLERTSGFGAGRARNAGAAEASGDVLVFLDADMLVGPEAIERVARWFDVAPYAAVTGRIDFFDDSAVPQEQLRRAIDTGTLEETLRSGSTDDQSYREKSFSRTNDLTSDCPDLFRVTVGAFMAVSGQLFRAVGGLRELGIRGIEDTEFGYRLHVAGALMVLDRSIPLWHQGKRHFDSSKAAQTRAARAPFMHDLIAAPTFREPASVTPTVPTVVLDCRSVSASASYFEELRGTPDVDIVFLFDPTSALRCDWFDQDDRFRIEAQMEPVDLAAVPFLVVPRSTIRFEDHSITELVELMRSRGLGVLHLLDGEGTTCARVFSARSLGRARLLGAAVEREVEKAGELFGDWWSPASDFGVSSGSS